MKRIILYSSPEGKIFPEILDLTFPKELDKKVFAYMPSDGGNTKEEYTNIWKGHANKYNADFVYINNSIKDAEYEVKKLLESNILVITGGNTFQLLHNLRKSGLDNAIKEFTRKEDYVLTGFSAGAIVLTPTINIGNLPSYDVNEVGIKDLTGLNIVDFEVFPHYSPSLKETLEDYRRTTKNQVKELSDEDYILEEK